MSVPETESKYSQDQGRARNAVMTTRTHLSPKHNHGNKPTDFQALIKYIIILNLELRKKVKSQKWY